MNIEILRGIALRMRRFLASHEELARKLVAMEKKYYAQFKMVFEAIRELTEPPPANRSAPLESVGEKHNSKRVTRPEDQKSTFFSGPGSREKSCR